MADSKSAINKAPGSNRVERLIERLPAVHYKAKASEDFGATFVSAGIKRQLGYEASQFVTNSGFWVECIHPDDRERVLAGLGELFEHGAHQHEYRFRHADGSWRTMRDELALIRADDGAAQEIVGCWFDVTERRQAETELRADAARYRSLLENTSDWIWEMDIDGRFTYSNGRLESVLEYTTNELSKEGYRSRLHHEDTETLAQTLASSIDNRTGWHGLILRHRDANGEYHYFESNSDPILDTAGNLVGFRGVDRDITARIRKDEQLQLSNERYELAARGTQGGLWDWDVVNGDVYFSPRWAEILGYGADELEPHVDTFSKLLHPEELRDTWRQVEAHLKHKQAFDAEFQLQHKDGYYVWVQSKGQAIWNEAGEALRMVGSIFDISDRKQASLKLAQAERRLNEAQHIAKMGNWERDVVTGESWWSDELYDILDFDPQTTRGSFERFLERVHADDRQAVIEFSDRTLNSVGRHDFELRAVLPDGGEKTLHSQGLAIFDENGQAIRMTGTLQDISERKLLEQQVLSLTKRLEAITDVAFDGIVVSENGIVVEGTEHFARRLGYDPSEVAGLPVTEFVAPQFVKTVISHMQLPLVEPFQIQLLQKDGTTFPVEACGTTITVDGRVFRISAFRDITAKAELEREIIAISERERRRIGRDLHDGVGQLLFAASLSLRTISQHLAKEDSPELDRLKDVQAIVDSSIEATRRVSHLLAPVVYGGEDLSTALTQLLTRIDQNTTASCKAICTFSGELHNAEKATHLYRIAQESVSNALKHSKADNIVLNFYPDGDLLCLEILDDGVGISPQEQSNPSGIGLKSLQYRARMIDGNLEIERLDDQGTRVRCTCPA